EDAARFENAPLGLEEDVEVSTVTDAATLDLDDAEISVRSSDGAPPRVDFATSMEQEEGDGGKDSEMWNSVT
ncbi:MAG: hypothetical protein MHPSP_004904, partial [Paramarteilia canceri]